MSKIIPSNPRRDRDGRARWRLTARSPRCLVLVVLAALCAVRVSPVHAEGLRQTSSPITGEPYHLFSTEDGIFALTTSRVIRRLSDNQLVLAPQPQSGYSTGKVICDVGPDGRAACLYRAARSEGRGKNTRVHIQLRLAISGQDRDQVLAQGYDKAGFDAHPEGILVAGQTPTLVWDKTVKVGDDEVTHTYLQHGRKQVVISLPTESWIASQARMGAARYHPAVQFFRLGEEQWALARDGHELVVCPLQELMMGGGDWQVIASDVQQDVRPVSTTDGYVYVFYHDAREEVAKVASSRDGRAWNHRTLDGPESGWQLDAVAFRSQALAVWYYRRDTYSKGLRAVRLQGGRLASEVQTVVRVEEHNTGWRPHLGVQPDGTTWVSWLHRNVPSEQRTWSRLKNPAELTQRWVTTADGAYKDWYVNGGVGVWYARWDLFDQKLSTEDTGGMRVGAANLDMQTNILVRGAVEARYKSVQLALAYAQNLVAEKARGIPWLPEELSWLFAAVQLDGLLLGHDIRLTGMSGGYSGSGTPGRGVSASSDEVKVSGGVLVAHLEALNKWRMKYGLQYASYHVPATVHTFMADAGQTSYRYTGSFLRDVAVDELLFTLGYSTLDYVSRYENFYSGLLLDGDVRFGPAFLHSKEGIPLPDNLITHTGMAWNLGGSLELGWLLLSRFRGLGGLGLYAKLVYRGELAYLIGAGKPEDRKADRADDLDVDAGIGLLNIRHGPMLEAGLIW